MNSIPYEESHVDQIELREHEAELIDLEIAKVAMSVSHTVTIVHEDRIIAIIGLQELWTGVAEMFVIPSKHLFTCPFRYVRMIRRYLDSMWKTGLFHRFQTHSFADDQTDKWMLVLGFKCEGTLSNFSAKRHNYRVWARVN